MSFETIPSLLSGLIATGLGLFVWSRAPRRTANSAFAWGMVGLGVVEFAHARLLGLDQVEAATWLQVALGAEALMLPGWVVFSLTFARADAGEELRRWRWPLAGITVLALAALAGSALHAHAPAPGQLLEDILPLSVYGKAVAVLALLTTVFVLFELESTFRGSRGMARWQIKYLILGVFAILGFHIFVLSDMVLVSALRLGHLSVQSTTALLGFALIGYSLVRHRLLEVDVFVSRHVVYHSLTVGAVGLYLLVMGAAASVIQVLDIPVNFFLVSLTIFVTAIGLLIVLLSEAVRRRVKRAIAHHFYRHKYDYRREWTEFTGKLASVLSAQAIASRLLGTVEDVMGVRKAALLLAQGGAGYRLVDAVGSTGRIRGIERDSPLITRIALEPRLLDLTSMAAAATPAEAVASLHAEGFTLLVPLAAKDELLGLLVVGPPSGSFTQEDEDLLATLAAQAATALLNARLAEQLAQARELEALNRVSSFILHDLKNCVSMLSLVTQNAEHLGSDPAFQRDALRTVVETVRKMRALIERLSHLPKDSELRLAPMDLNHLVQEVVDDTRVVANGGVQLSTELGVVPPITADEEEVRRVLENLLINAVEAVRADGAVSIRTTARNGSVSLEVSDNGPGVPDEILRTGLFTPFKTTKRHGLGIGLYQVKSILQAHGADIDIVSREGCGTTVRVAFPPLRRPQHTGKD